MLYDFYHEQISGGNLIKKLVDNEDLVALVHVADVPGRQQPGTGEVSYRSILQKLAEIQFSGKIAMEFLPVADPVKELRKARRYVECCDGPHNRSPSGAAFQAIADKSQKVGLQQLQHTGAVRPQSLAGGRDFLKAKKGHPSEKSHTTRVFVLKEMFSNRSAAIATRRGKTLRMTPCLVGSSSL